MEFQNNSILRNLTPNAVNMLEYLLENDEKQETLSELWDEAHEKLWQDENLPELHLWDDGIVKGDASQEEVEELVKIGLAEEMSYGGFTFMKIEEKYIDILEGIIERKYNYLKAKPTCEYETEN